MLESHRCQHADEVVDKVRVNGVGSYQQAVAATYDGNIRAQGVDFTNE
jgi:hypothetical protein